MARSKITSRSKDLVTDDGSVLVSIIEGEQTRISLTIGWVTNLAGYTITAKVIEANNVQDTGALPATAATNPTITALDIIDTVSTDNVFDIVIPEGLIDSWATTPIPDKPVYGFIGLEIRDPGVGNEQLIWKPLRGLIEVRYSPTEVV
jgi:hypothetical protein